MAAAWRRARLATNITAVVGVAVFPVWIATAVFAVVPGNGRLRFVAQLLVDVDGAPAAQFLQAVARSLADPRWMIA